MNAVDGPIQGLTRAEAAFDSAAEKINKSFVGDRQHSQDQVSLSDAMVALLNSKNDYEANLQSLKAGNEMTKRLLDVLG
jgi:Flagellar basal body rod FlgEFG protein C-terminal